MKSVLKAFYPIYFAIAICCAMAIRSGAQVSGWPYPFSKVNPPTLASVTFTSSSGTPPVLSSDNDGSFNFTTSVGTATVGTASGGSLILNHGFMWGGFSSQDIVEVNAPRAPLNVFVQGPLNATATYSNYVATQATHIRRVAFAEMSGATGCSTLPTLTIFAPTVVYTTPGITNGTDVYDSGLLATPIAIPAGTAIKVESGTLQSGCTTAGNAAINVTMEMTTD